jgi:hypothetical protein
LIEDNSEILSELGFLSRKNTVAEDGFNFRIDSAIFLDIQLSAQNNKELR